MKFSSAPESTNAGRESVWDEDTNLACTRRRGTTAEERVRLTSALLITGEPGLLLDIKRQNDPSANSTHSGLPACDGASLQDPVLSFPAAFVPPEQQVALTIWTPGGVEVNAMKKPLMTAPYGRS